MNMTMPSDRIMNTHNYYQTNAKRFFDDTVHLDMENIRQAFLELIPEHGKILDAGCGSGRDTLNFIKNGYEVVAFDFSEEMVKLASEHTGQTILNISFEDISFDDEFDGVWASASLLHVPKKSIHTAISNLARSLKRNGILYSSFKYGENEINKNNRLFNNYTEFTFKSLVDSIGSLDLIRHWKTEDNRPERKGEFWLNVLLLRKS